MHLTKIMLVCMPCNRDAKWPIPASNVALATVYVFRVVCPWPSAAGLHMCSASYRVSFKGGPDLCLGPSNETWVGGVLKLQGGRCRGADCFLSIGSVMRCRQFTLEISSCGCGETPASSEGYPAGRCTISRHTGRAACQATRGSCCTSSNP